MTRQKKIDNHDIQYKLKCFSLGKRVGKVTTYVNKKVFFSLSRPRQVDILLRCCFPAIKFELSSVVTLHKRRVVWVVFSEMQEVFACVSRWMAALFADVNFISALFVSVADVHAVDFATVRFKRTPLCKGSVALATCVRFHTCKKRNGEIRL